MICPKCKGEKKIDLFTSSEPCDTCNGSGSVPDAAEDRFITTRAMSEDEDAIHTILITDEEQRVQVAMYADVTYGFGNYRIELCKDPGKRYKELGGRNVSVCNYA